jgi:hypothetical protein
VWTVCEAGSKAGWAAPAEREFLAGRLAETSP